jgi:predicted dinucleotide-binding enzyme
LSKCRDLRPDILAGRIVIDVMNFRVPTGGTMAEFEGPHSSNGVVPQYLSQARIVHSFNRMGYQEIEEEAGPATRRTGAHRQSPATMPRHAQWSPPSSPGGL